MTALPPPPDEDLIDTAGEGANPEAPLFHLTRMGLSATNLSRTDIRIEVWRGSFPESRWPRVNWLARLLGRLPDMTQLQATMAVGPMATSTWSLPAPLASGPYEVVGYDRPRHVMARRLFRLP